MGRAARTAFRSILLQWPDLLKGQSLQVFCGGNNGGDGFLIAVLAVRKRVPVSVLTLKSPSLLSGDALTAYQACQKAGVDIQPYTQEAEIKGDVLVDAMLGTGIDREVTGVYREVIERINQSGGA